MPGTVEKQSVTPCFVILEQRKEDWDHVGQSIWLNQGAPSSGIHSMIDKTANVGLWFPNICTYMHAHPHTYTRISAYIQWMRWQWVLQFKNRSLV